MTELEFRFKKDDSDPRHDVCDRCGEPGKFRLVDSEGTKLFGCRDCWFAMRESNPDFEFENPVQLLNHVRAHRDYDALKRAGDIWRLFVATTKG